MKDFFESFEAMQAYTIIIKSHEVISEAIDDMYMPDLTKNEFTELVKLCLFTLEETIKAKKVVDSDYSAELELMAKLEARL